MHQPKADRRPRRPVGQVCHDDARIAPPCGQPLRWALTREPARLFRYAPRPRRAPMTSAARADDAIAFPVLIGDIGGTNARFALLPDKEAEPELFHPIATADHADIESAVRDAVFAHTATRPVSAIID